MIPWNHNRRDQVYFSVEKKRTSRDNQVPYGHRLRELHETFIVDAEWDPDVSWLL